MEVSVSLKLKQIFTITAHKNDTDLRERQPSPWGLEAHQWPSYPHYDETLKHRKNKQNRIFKIKIFNAETAIRPSSFNLYTHVENTWPCSTPKKTKHLNKVTHFIAQRAKNNINVHYNSFCNFVHINDHRHSRSGSMELVRVKVDVVTSSNSEEVKTGCRSN